MDATNRHPFAQAIEDLESALALGMCSQTVDERIARLQAWLDAELEAGWLPQEMHTLLSAHVENVARACRVGEPEVTLAAVAELAETATLLTALSRKPGNAHVAL